MLFYMKYDTQKDIEQIPSSYLVLNISKLNKKIHHPNLNTLKMLPDDEANKDGYIHQLITDYKEGVAVIANYLINHKHNESIVVVYKNNDIDHDFNPAKVLCKFIERRYGYKSYKFTTTVVKEMRISSKFSNDGLTRLIKDMNNLRKKI